MRDVVFPVSQIAKSPFLRLLCLDCGAHDFPLLCGMHFIAPRNALFHALIWFVSWHDIACFACPKRLFRSTMWSVLFRVMAQPAV